LFLLGVEQVCALKNFAMTREAMDGKKPLTQGREACAFVPPEITITRPSLQDKASHRPEGKLFSKRFNIDNCKVRRRSFALVSAILP
jgi:hypothetical protein